MLFRSFQKQRSRRKSRTLQKFNQSAALMSSELLESRQLLTIIWGNEGDVTSDTDSFNSEFGANATAARAIVNHAIEDWNATLDSPLNLVLQLSAGDLSQSVPNAAGVTHGDDFLFATNSVTQGIVVVAAGITLDDDAAGEGWFFDSTVADDSEFSIINPNSPFVGEGSEIGLDFYTVVVHELGHALGYLGHSADNLDLMAPGSPERADERRLISDEAALLLAGAYEYSITSLPSQRDTLYVNGPTIYPTDGDDNIWVESNQYGTMDIWVNGTREQILVGNSTTVAVNGGDGNDQITVDYSKVSFVNPVVVDGGAGLDSVHYRKGIYAASVGEKSVSQYYVHPLGLVGPYIANFSIDAEILNVIGTSGDDQVNVGDNSFNWVAVYGNAGNDFIDGWLGGTTSVGVLFAFGGAGNDVLWGTPNADILMGDSGDDTIWGGDGRDLLFGGDGADSIGAVTANSSGDEDIVVGGLLTAYDVPVGPSIGLWGLIGFRNEWISNRSRSERITNLANDPGLNVVSDGDIDTETFNSGSDWRVSLFET